MLDEFCARAGDKRSDAAPLLREQARAPTRLRRQVETERVAGASVVTLKASSCLHAGYFTLNVSHAVVPVADAAVWAGRSGPDGRLFQPRRRDRASTTYATLMAPSCYAPASTSRPSPNALDTPA